MHFLLAAWMTETVTMEDAITELRALTAKYDEPSIQDPLRRLSDDQGSENVEDWAKALYISKRDHDDEHSVSLNNDRKAILNLLYMLVNLWNKVHNELGAEQADKFEDSIIDIFKVRRIGHILSFGVAMDRAQALYAMKIDTWTKYGMHWYSKFHFNSSLPFCNYDYSQDQTEQERQEWSRLLEGYPGSPTMNRRLFQLLFSKRMGFQQRHPDTFGRWSKPHAAEFVERPNLSVSLLGIQPPSEGERNSSVMKEKAQKSLDAATYGGSRQEGAKQFSQNHDDIREQLRLVIEKKRRDPVEVTSSYIDEIITGDALGEGYFGVAYKGFDRVLGKAFALKKVFENAPSARIRGIHDSFRNEMNIVGRLDHPNIARLYGFYHEPNDFERTCIIYELAANGSLEGFWKDEAQRQRLCAGVTRIRIAYQVARALQYMHEGLDGQAVCFHCDIKSANVCLASDFTVRIIDCGLSKYIEKMDERLPSTGLVGTVGYIAPDYSDGSIRYDSSCDVFAFGVFLCELITGTTSPSGEKGHYVVFEKTKVKALSDCLDACVEWDGSTKERFVELAQKCIKPSMRDRPPIGDVVETLHQLLYLGSKTKEESVGAKGVSKGRNVITVLYSEPLVYNDWYGNMRTFEKLDVDMERAVLKQCLTEASRDIDLFFDSATDLRLLAARIQRPICLHYSGHGTEMYLPFESGRGAPGRALWLESRELRDLIARDEGQPFKLVFVSACHSQHAGEVFVAAGVPHVVCCEQKSQIGDVGARDFTYQFYRALATGETVKFSFEQGCMAVTKEERTSFLLLPEDENHDVSIFDANVVEEWSPRSRLSDNLIQDKLSYRIPQLFLGREMDMYLVLNLVLTKQLVSVVGEKGVGRKSLAYAMCHYINERRSTMLPTIDSIVFSIGSSSGFLRVIQNLEKELMTLGGETAGDVSGDMDSLIDSVCNRISEKALLVIDGTDLCKGSVDHDNLVMFLRRLRETRRTRVLLIVLEPLQHPALPEQDYSLMPLDYDNTIQLFCYLCPHLNTTPKRYREKLVTAVEEWNRLGDVRKVESLYLALGGGIPGTIVEKSVNESSRNKIDEILSDRAAPPIHL